MEDMVLRGKSVSMNSGPTHLKHFDSRPEEMRNTPGYPGMFRGVWINSSTKNPAILQLYEPANVYGVANDHDYLPLSPEIMFPENLQVTTITEEQCMEIEKKTCGHLTSCGRKNVSYVYILTPYDRICMATDRTDFPKLASLQPIRKLVELLSTIAGNMRQPRSQLTAQ
ncbi:hypothetical protein LSH36_191g02017 [Paralvinella palmiformis]|uniref:Uncharacterized protein n=1 Tax=Paralvinella palmiformis TaxID=53620 RepID=A0AAD9N552_9ANNE|nr:hypothetical protein LSH36_191g02017 [Paralvinella palmiformis]